MFLEWQKPVKLCLSWDEVHTHFSHHFLSNNFIASALFRLTARKQLEVVVVVIIQKHLLVNW